MSIFSNKQLWMTLISKVMLVLPLITGCAISYQDQQGIQHIIGLSHLALTGIKNNALTAGDKVEVQNLGLLFISGPVYNGAGLGDTRQSKLYIKNDALAIVDDDSQPETSTRATTNKSLEP